MRVSVLALQGGFQAHKNSLDALGHSSHLVKKANEISCSDALVIPGGESSTLLKLMSHELKEVIKDFHQQKKPIFGTCAGAILLAREVIPQQFSFGFIDIEVTRNAYGSQINSFNTTQSLTLPGQSQIDMEFIFIRAPKITQVGKEVKVLKRVQNEPILVQQDNILVATFHPELSSQHDIHKYFATMIDNYCY